MVNPRLNCANPDPHDPHAWDGTPDQASGRVPQYDCDPTDRYAGTHLADRTRRTRRVAALLDSAPAAREAVVAAAASGQLVRDCWGSVILPNGDDVTALVDVLHRARVLERDETAGDDRDQWKPADPKARLAQITDMWHSGTGCVSDFSVGWLIYEVGRLSAILDDSPPYHLIEIGEGGWTIKHPISCRPNLFNCPVNRAAQQMGEPPVDVGLWRVDQHGGQMVFIEREGGAQ